MEYRWISSLEKVFQDVPLEAVELCEAKVLKNETYSFQFAYRSDIRLDDIEIKVISPLKEYIKVRRVAPVPVEFVASEFDDNVLRKTPGLYPDLLTEIADFRASPFQWHSIWFTVKCPGSVEAGTYPLQLEISNSCPWNENNDLKISTGKFLLNLSECVQPESELKCTEWFHGDCLFAHYKIDPWNAKSWSILEKYFTNMTAHGINMIYTPLFTPPLDTLEGGNRPTTQLVRVNESESGWEFDFTNLRKWLNLAKKCGFKYFECSHLFTQWGAKYTPKIIVEKNGMLKRRFGWDVSFNSNDYISFLSTFLPELRKCLIEQGIYDRAYFHISDEPGLEDIESFKSASEVVHRFMPDAKFIDALSNPEFYSKKLVDIPIPASNHFDSFQDCDLPERWVYYCTSQWDKTSNQFMHLPSARNRIMGIIMFCSDVEGFLHWGYNFWFSQFSRKIVDPYKTTDAGWGFQPGDAFKVYPGKNGPEDSIRHEVFFDAIQDYALLREIEKITGRDTSLKLVKDVFGYLPTMTEYPREQSKIFQLREKAIQTYEKMTKNKSEAELIY